MVSWDDCVLFCQKLTQRERAAGRLGPKQVYRLPTEAEWEYACRAESGGVWCFGDDETRLAEYAWIEGNSGKETHAVGTKRANAWGLYDVYGNVYEWCSDWYGNYSGGFEIDWRGVGLPPNRVLRSCCWDESARVCSSASRNHCNPGYRYHVLGLRLAAGQEP